MIQVKQLCFQARHDGETTSEPIDFQVLAAESLALVGSDASTRPDILKILMGLNRTYRGTVHFLDKELSDWSRDFYEVVGCHLSGQPFAPFSKLTAEENLAYFAGTYRGETLAVSEVLDGVGLQKESRLRVSEFSPGMLARLGLARAILNHPQALFLDEPLRHVEAEFQAVIHSWIRQQKKAGRALVLGFRDLEMAKELCDRHILLAPESASDREPKGSGA